MTYDPDIHNRHSIRLKGYDYTGGGAYFVTMCSAGRECVFGEMVGGEMALNDAGRMVVTMWSQLPERFPSMTIDEYVVMPNHFHGIIVIHDNVGAGSPRPISGMANQNLGGVTSTNQNQGEMTPANQHQGGVTPPLRKPSLGQVVGYFKYQTTKQINVMRDNPGVPVWQRNYYERVLRNEAELDVARRYIQDNPRKWAEDRENPVNAPDPTNIPSP